MSTIRKLTGMSRWWTATTDRRAPVLAWASTSGMTDGAPDASMKASVPAMGPNMNGSVPCTVGDAGPEVTVGRVDGRHRAELEGQLEPAGREVDDDDLLVAAIDEGRQRAQPDRAAAEDHDLVVGPDLGLVGRVHAHRQRLGQGGDGEVEARRHGVQAAAAGDLADQEVGA